MKKTCFVLLACASLALSCSDDSSSNNGNKDGGAGGDASVEPLVSDDDLIKGCIISTSCGVQSYPSVVGCIDNYANVLKVNRTAPAYSKIYRCAIKANGDCEKVKKCWNIGQSCTSSFAARCDGTLAVSCDVVGNSKTFAIDCAAAGMKCGTRKSGGATAYCTPDSCYGGTAPACVGSQVQSCNEGIVEMQDCSVKGQLCGKGGKKSGITCIGAKKDSCNPEFFVPQCKGASGNIANQCASGKEHQVDCSKLTLQGSKCKEGLCVSKGAACDKSFNRCAGDDLEVCFDGSWKKYTCASMGLGKCKTKTSGSSTWATCGDPAYP